MAQEIKGQEGFQEGVGVPRAAQRVRSTRWCWDGGQRLYRLTFTPLGKLKQHEKSASKYSEELTGHPAGYTLALIYSIHLLHYKSILFIHSEVMTRLSVQMPLMT